MYRISLNFDWQFTLCWILIIPFNITLSEISWYFQSLCLLLRALAFQFRFKNKCFFLVFLRSAARSCDSLLTPKTILFMWIFKKFVVGALFGPNLSLIKTVYFPLLFLWIIFSCCKNFVRYKITGAWASARTLSQKKGQISHFKGISKVTQIEPL